MQPFLSHLAKDHLARHATVLWLEPLAHLALPYERVDLPLVDCTALRLHAAGARRAPDLSRELQQDLAQLLMCFPGGVHLRLEGCSLRVAGRVPRVTSLTEAVAALCAVNSRAASCLALLEPHLPEQGIYLFPWVEIADSHEFRILIRDRVALGITPYHGNRAYSAALYARRVEIEAALLTFARDLVAFAPEPDFAADVFLDAALTPRLIEINPFGPTTNTGLYTRGDFDGRLRYPAPPQQSTTDFLAKDIWRI